MDTTTIHQLPVADLAAHPDNLRVNPGDLTGLTKSIKERGILEPLLVAPGEDGTAPRVIAGHRRLLAAVEAGLETAPCHLRPDLAGESDQVITMLVENVHREDLTPAEQAKGFAQLALLGVSDTKAARATGMGRTFVRKARAVAADHVATDALAQTPGLSFDQALAIAEVTSDDAPEDRERLAELATNAPGRFEHAVSRIREDREEARRRAERIEALKEQGINVLDEDAMQPPAARLHELTSADLPAGEVEALDPEAHASCPGHAVTLSRWNSDTIVSWCLDPAANGHRHRWGNTSSKPVEDEAERERKRDERREVIANNKAWRAAEPVRREYLRKLLAGKRVPKGTLRYVVGEVVTDPEGFGRTGSEGLLADLTGATVSVGWGRTVGVQLARRSSDARLALVLLAQHAADLEGEMGVHTWRNKNPRAARYLAYLADTGYTLAEVEQLVVDSLDQQHGDGGDDEDHGGDAGDDSELAEVVHLDVHNGTSDPNDPVTEEDADPA